MAHRLPPPTENGEDRLQPRHCRVHTGPMPLYHHSHPRPRRYRKNIKISQIALIVFEFHRIGEATTVEPVSRYFDVSATVCFGTDKAARRESRGAEQS